GLGDELDGHLALEGAVVGEVDDAHAALAQPAHETEVVHGRGGLPGDVRDRGDIIVTGVAVGGMPERARHLLGRGSALAEPDQELIAETVLVRWQSRLHSPTWHCMLG